MEGEYNKKGNGFVKESKTSIMDAKVNSSSISSKRL